MKQRDLQNKRLNDIEKKLLGAAVMPEDEIEKIVGNSQLFGSVMARIEAEKSSCRQKSVFRNRDIFSIYNWRTVSLSCAVLLVMIAAAILNFRQTKNSPHELTAERNDVTNFPSSRTSVEAVPLPADNLPVVSKPVNFKPKNQTLAPLRIIKKETIKPRSVSEKAKSKLPPPPISEDKIFYSLALPGNAEINDGDRKIVRTELTRPALFALGVNVPAGGDDNRKFKTDLIVGSDGVAQAIRFVE